MIAFSLSLTIIIQLHITGSVHALQCYNCSSVADADECLTITECNAGQSCYMEFEASGQTSTLGCTDNQQCGVTGNVAGSLVGRDLSLRQEPDCYECCSTDKCNKNLCVHLKPVMCIDDASVDCARMNTFFNICKDIHPAKLICPKFCALCTLVDGNWGSWSPWSTCGVTCENGTQTRQRTCTDPAPADGGLDCVGSSSDTKPCLKQLCPVHGGWTTWSDWDTCSMTCEVGIEKRHRNCSNPVPDRNGFPCVGDTFEARICLPGPCAIDGNWSSWSPWSTCDVTCENGTRARKRTCTDPAPKDGGLDCIGSSSDTKPCFKQLCPVHGGWTTWWDWDTCSMTCEVGIEKRQRNCSNPVPDRNGIPCFGDTFEARICLPGPCANGGWSDWGQWSTCTVTCGYGMQSRSRTCTDPQPSSLGKYCEGDPLENVSCRKDTCTPTVVFKAKGVTDTTPSAGQTMKFGTTLVNEGHAYSTWTGIFTAPVDGIYSFSTQFCVHPQEFITIAIIVDGVTYATLYVYDHDTYPCNTADTVAVLHAQSKVFVKCTSVSSGNVIVADSFRMNSFSGYLVHQ